MPDKIAGLVLAGGRSSRMGGPNKALIDLNGERLVARAARRLSAQVGNLVINANADEQALDDLGYQVIADTMEGYQGPLAGILAGLIWARMQGASHVASVAVDTPFFPDDLVMRLSAAASPTHPIAMSGDEEGLYRHPTFSLWPVDLADALRADLEGGLRKIVAWTDKFGCATVRFPNAPYDPFFNINTPDDLDKARAMLDAYDL